MSLVTAINLPDRLLMIEDGRTLEITQFYASSGAQRLTASSELRKEDRIESHEGAEVCVAEFPDSGGAHLIIDLSELQTLDPKKAN